MVICGFSHGVNLASLAIASSLALASTPQGGVHIGAGVPGTPTLHPYVFDGGVAFNRTPSTGTTPTPQLDLLAGCSPLPIEIGWAPRPFPKFDPFRNVVLASKPLIPSGYELRAIDELGHDTLFPAAGGTPGYSEGGVAPVGDGRIYLLAASGFLTCFDANDTWHFVLNPAGQPYVFPYGVVTDVVYDSASNALIVLQSTIGTAGACTPSGYANAVVTKIQLDPAGAAVVPPLGQFTFCLGLQNTAVPRIARHHDGRLLFRVGGSANPNSAEVYALDPVTMTTTWFCTQQLPPGSGWMNVGGSVEFAYSAVEGAVLGATVGVPCGLGCTQTATLRSYPEASIGTGVPVCSWQGEYRSQFVDLQRP